MSMKNRFYFAITPFIFFILCSCAKEPEKSIAVIWSDKVEFASYCELFNSLQNNFKIIAEYKQNPADSLIRTKNPPDIVAGSWLKGKEARIKFKKINYLLDKEKINASAFYEELLALGNSGGNQYLLPVNFNLPTIIFSSANKNLLKNGFTVSLDEIKELSPAFNKQENGVYTKMCFSPRWEDECLYMTARGFQSAFEEAGNFFSWDDIALKKSISYIRDWSLNINTSPQKEDEFKFKYLYYPPYTLVTSELCMFYYLPSDMLFSLEPEKLQNIDFRWLEYDGKSTLFDDILYAGICSGAKNVKAAEEFFIWFFSEEGQKKILERTNSMKLTVNGFALAGGFSALRPVTEKILPAYYPLLLTHLPQNQTLKAPHVLPNSWIKLKNEIILPYLKKASYYSDISEIKSIPSLDKNINEWHKASQKH